MWRGPPQAGLDFRGGGVVQPVGQWGSLSGFPDGSRSAVLGQLAPILSAIRAQWSAVRGAVQRGCGSAVQVSYVGACGGTVAWWEPSMVSQSVASREKRGWGGGGNTYVYGVRTYQILHLE